MNEKLENLPKGVQIALTIFIVIFLIGTLIYTRNLPGIDSSPPPSPQSAAERNPAGFATVVTACQLEATRRLRNPETAEPQPIENIDKNTQYSVENGKTVLKSWIRGESDVGLKVKMRYICNMNEDGSGTMSFRFVTQ